MIANSIRFGLPIPEPIVNKPKLPVYCEVFYILFIELASERTSNDGYLNQIPITKIVEYCKFHNFDYDLICEAILYVGALDRHFVKKANDKMSSKMKKSANKR